jgi:multidrug efflux pump subunit AcrA (membrane-fusion protein)
MLGCFRAPSVPEAAAFDSPAGSAPAPVASVRPRRTTLHRGVSQPGFTEAFERTPVFAKLPGYVKKWPVDIGDEVKQGDLLAELYIPELADELRQKEAQVAQAEQAYQVAQAQVVTARAQVVEAQAALPKAKAEHNRWQIEHGRIDKLAEAAIVDAQTRDETWNLVQAAEAGWKGAQARIESAQATLKHREQALIKAQADTAVAKADARRVASLLGYTRLTAPYAGVVTRRNVNTGDFVQAPGGGMAQPLLVVERHDVIRVFVRVPEVDAVWIVRGAAARVRVESLRDEEFDGTVTRTAFSLDPVERTLLTEIDLPNPRGRLRPGMYAYATITVEHRDVLALPAGAVATEGDVNRGFQSFCFLVRDGKARRTPVRTGLRDGAWIEVLKYQAPSPAAGKEPAWQNLTGNEQVIGDASAGVTDGQPVTGR